MKVELEPNEVAVKEGLDIILDFINFFEGTCPDATKIALDFLKSKEEGRKNIEMAFNDSSSIFISLFKDIEGDYLMLLGTNFDAIEAYYKLNYKK